MKQPMAEIIIRAYGGMTKELSETETGYNKNIDL
jgi:hypothetical protein